MSWFKNACGLVGAGILAGCTGPQPYNPMVVVPGEAEIAGVSLLSPSEANSVRSGFWVNINGRWVWAPNPGNVNPTDILANVDPYVPSVEPGPPSLVAGPETAVNEPTAPTLPPGIPPGLPPETPTVSSPDLGTPETAGPLPPAELADPPVAQPAVPEPPVAPVENEEPGSALGGTQAP